ncbi:uncharacterized protein GGS22DRAFT_175434 [Annulohypoxylon maeteangense]|uniref:uncharacterized protein n=1 Tax=Annulohypoxylon maeteangense TaxID=1927788 RepID=UPI002008434B|nr:uncharacterized protein GGS22DRAFT_175434 [Annulohypoxylon maeteangense]KAI0880213.1 hypothetical protein GGS22DRAFT_175434 [Annulohypoxylon maeteangense]
MCGTQADLKLDHSNTGPVFLIPTIILNVLSTIFVGLRLYARRFKGLRLQFDDWIVVVALFFNHAQLIDEGIMVKYGLGINGEIVAATYPGGVSNFLEAFFFVQLIYSCLSPLAKISLLALYYRTFFVSRTLRISVWIMTALIISWGISVFVTSIFTCNPIRGFWDLSIGAKCIDSALFFEAITIPNIILDLGTVILPIREVWKLHMGRDRKLALTAIFTVGSVVVLAAIARLITVKLYQPAGGSLNTTQALVPALLATSFEVNFAIFGACLPPIIPLWRHWFGQNNDTSNSSKSTPPFHSIITIGQRSNRQPRKLDMTFEMLEEEDSRENLTQTHTVSGTEGIALTTVSAREWPQGSQRQIHTHS